MNDDVVPLTEHEEESSFSGQLGLVLGGFVAVAFLVALATLFALGGVETILWLRLHLPF